MKTLAVVARISQTQIGNSLNSRYFSGAPFLFGEDLVAKFAVTPMTDENARAPENPGTDYLREAMKKSLDIASGKPAFFDFQVQLRADKYLPVEDATAEWPEAIAPFQNVATIRIERQNFDHPYQITECEHLVFTPWHGLRAHQPIGGINRLRRDVYAASSKFRARQSEPSDFPRWPW